MHVGQHVFRRKLYRLPVPVQVIPLGKAVGSVRALQHAAVTAKVRISEAYSSRNTRSQHSGSTPCIVTSDCSDSCMPVVKSEWKYVDMEAKIT